MSEDLNTGMPEKEVGQDNGATGSDSSVDAKVAELEQQLKDEKNKYLYLYAEFDNFKKRSIKERSDLIRFGWEGVARELVGVLENLQRAVEHIPPQTDENLKKGIEMVYSHFRSTLEKQGVSEVKTIGESFNPEFHEALGQEPSGEPQGTITQVLTKGYTLHGRLIRPARVVVSTGLPTQG